MFVVCGEPCGVWRKSAPFLCMHEIIIFLVHHNLNFITMGRYFTIVALVLILLSSCSESTFYQVYEVQSNDVEQKDDALVYENNDCEIVYNLWADSGDLSFLFRNKTDKYLYLVMPKSFFILNGIANDYYSETTRGVSKTTSASVSASGQASVLGYALNNFQWHPTMLSRWKNASVGVATTETVATKEFPLVCIPPKSAKVIKGFNISNYVFKDCEKQKENYPSKTSSIIKYTETQTPLSFQNSIAYSFDEQVTDVNYINNHFWVSSLQNFSHSAAFISKMVRKCGSYTEEKAEYSTVKAPNKFYNRYVRPYSR